MYYDQKYCFILLNIVEILDEIDDVEYYIEVIPIEFYPRFVEKNKFNLVDDNKYFINVHNYIIIFMNPECRSNQKKI